MVAAIAAQGRLRHKGPNWHNRPMAAAPRSGTGCRVAGRRSRAAEAGSSSRVV